MPNDEFTPDGKVRILVAAEIFGAWAVTKDCSKPGAFCITDVRSGKRFSPPPVLFDSISRARAFATLLREKFPRGYRKVDEALIKASSKKFV